MLSHVCVGADDLKRAKGFYDPVLALLGWRKHFADFERGWMAWRPPASDRPLFIVAQPYDGADAQPANGGMIALLSPNRRLVDEAYVTALSSGGRDEGAPALRPQYHPAFYGAYFRDVDGNKLCVCTHTSPVDLVQHQSSHRMTRSEMARHCEAWAQAWNSRDVELVLSGFADNATFRSPLAVKYAGSDTLVGKPAIRAYWRAALATVKSLRFQVTNAICDEDGQTLAIHYAAQLDERMLHVCEILEFGPNGIWRGEALYGGSL